MLSLGNQIVVGVGGDFAGIRDAIESITDNSAQSPYQIALLPGIYRAFDAKPYVDVVGPGVKSRLVETSGDTNEYIRSVPTRI